MPSELALRLAALHVQARHLGLQEVVRVGDHISLLKVRL